MNEKLNEALDHIGDVHLLESIKPKRQRSYWVAAIAAILALVMFLVPLLGIGNGHNQHNLQVPVITRPSQPPVPDPTGIHDPNALPLANLLSAPQYPQMVTCPRMEDYPDYKDYNAAYTIWQQSQNAQYDQPQGYADNLTDFFQESIHQFLNAEENSAYSPLNVYMALAMLAETTGGNSRQQILDALGADSIQALREQASHVWNAHYSDDGVTSLLLGNSLWLDEAYSFRRDTVDRLASNYYASSFWGDLGTPSMNQQLQTWLDANTGGLLQEQAKQVQLDPDTVFALATTVYFAAGWTTKFYEQNNQEMVFHSAAGDLTTTFMRQTFLGYTYYWGDNFGAIQLELSGENAMWLILPDEGYTVTDILESDDYLRLTMDPAGWLKKSNLIVRLSLPKFDVTSNISLKQGLQAMGITDVFQPSISDFTPLTDAPDLFVSDATHAARVVIDEEGCVAAAFTVIICGATGAPNYKEIDFTLDRPFLFVVSSRDHLPLFVGTVAQP